MGAIPVLAMRFSRPSKRGEPSPSDDPHAARGERAADDEPAI
jgi:hypothetical protein